jgi:peroxiredoxin/thiol-disulfide isomerase/thioredoxin
MSRGGLVLITTLVLVGVLVGCRSTTPPASDKQGGLSRGNSLPQFAAVDSEGKQIQSSQTAHKAKVIAFFDPGSVQAWRTLAKLSDVWAKSDSIVVLGVAGNKEGSSAGDEINALKRQYNILFPLIIDRDDRLVKVFGIQTCCDHIFTYDTQETMRSSARLNQSFDQIGNLVAELNHLESGTTTAAEKLKDSNLYSSLKIHRDEGGSQALPVAAGAPTIVNLFDEFCTECLTGTRFETLTHLAESPGGAGHVVAVFSDKKFTARDLDNFKKILPIRFSIETGSIDAAAPYLINGRLLVVFDSNKNLLWQERSEMTEQQIISETSRFLQSSQ